MASDLFGKANDEFINENYEAAVELYGEAIALDKTKDDFYCNRAQAHLKLNQYKEAVEDASEALNINPKNKKAHLRKGTALFHLEDYPAAKEAFEDGQAVDSEDKNFKTWIRKCEAEIDLSKQNTSKVGVSNPPEQTKTTPNKTTPEQSTTSNTTSNTEQKPVIAMPTKEKSRYDWYQTTTHIVVTILLKNVKEEDMDINIQENSLSATVKLPTGSDYSLELDLSYPINPQQSTTKLMKSKIEVKLKKLEGIQWKKLEGEVSTVKQTMNTADDSDVVQTYPSSSHITRNWDKIAKDVDKEEEKKEGDAALNDLFQKIYKDGTDEQKKAMAKSFSESGGTCLSTNWDEIKQKKTEIKPPDGCEFKKY